MTTKLEQAMADLEGKRSERAYDAWRGWSHEYAMNEIERTLTNSGEPTSFLGTSESRQGKQSDGLLTISSRRGVWTAMVVASIVGAIAWGLIFLLGRWVVQVYG